jgi:plastocyanin
MKPMLITLLVAGALVAAGCGDDDNGDSGGSGSGSADSQSDSGRYGGGSSAPDDAGSAQTLKIDADPGGQLKFTKDKLTARAGEVSIEMGNPSDLPHAVEIEGNGVEAKGETVQKGGTSTATAEVKAGTYEFYCPVPGHKEGGMTGTLTVK